MNNKINVGDRYIAKFSSLNGRKKGDEYKVDRVMSEWVSARGEDTFIYTTIDEFLKEFAPHPNIHNVKEGQKLTVIKENDMCFWFNEGDSYIIKHITNESIRLEYDGTTYPFLQTRIVSWEALNYLFFNEPKKDEALSAIKGSKFFANSDEADIAFLRVDMGIYNESIKMKEMRALSKAIGEFTMKHFKNEIKTPHSLQPGATISFTPIQTSPIDNVTTERLDAALRLCEIYLDTKMVDHIIDVVELIAEKGGEVTVDDLTSLKMDWAKTDLFQK